MTPCRGVRDVPSASTTTRSPIFAVTTPPCRIDDGGTAARAAQAGRGPHTTALADRQRQRLAVDVLVESVRVRARIGLGRRGSAALEHVEAVDVVRLADVHAWANVAVVRPP